MPRRLAAVPIACSIAAVWAGTALAVTQLPGIRSPSGNIKCLFVPGRPSMLLCTIAHADYGSKLVKYCGSPPIGVDWAGFTLSATRKGSVNCSGGVLYNPDTQKPSYTTLPYGGTWRHGPFTCSSRVTGVTCRSRAGHGLYVSRQTWRGW